MIWYIVSKTVTRKKIWLKLKILEILELFENSDVIIHIEYDLF